MYGSDNIAKDINDRRFIDCEHVACVEWFSSGAQ